MSFAPTRAIANPQIKSRGRAEKAPLHSPYLHNRLGSDCSAIALRSTEPLALFARPGRRINLNFVPPYCPLKSNRMMNPIARPWGLMHKHVTHNKCYATCGQFADATLDFLRVKVPKERGKFRDWVTANFRVINPKDFRVVT